MNPSIRFGRFPGSLIVGLTIGLLALTTGCRAFENAGSDLDHGLRTTQQDLQHGIRGEPEPSGPRPAAAASTVPPATTAPTATPTAPPAPTATAAGVSL